MAYRGPSTALLGGTVEVEPDEAAFVALLARRAQIALWIVIASNLFFAITDLRLTRQAFVAVAGLKLLQIAAVVVGLRALRGAGSRRAVIAIVLAEAAVVSGLTAWSGAAAGDVVTTMILWIAVPFGTTALLPWGAGPQLGLTVIAGLAMLLNVYLARGNVDLAFGFPSVGVLVTLGVSVALAHEFERQRRALADENRARARAEGLLRTALASLDERVRERTSTLERTNIHLQEARDVAEAAEHRFRTISRLTSDYAYCFRVEPDLSSIIEWITEPSFERVTGYSTAEVTAMGGGLALVHPDDMPIALRRLESLLAGKPDVSEFRITTKDRGVRWIREHGYPEWDAAQAAVIRIFGAAQDFTEQRQAEERLADALRQRENVMNTVPEIIYTLDRRGCLRDWNRRLETVTGRTAASLTGQPATELFAPDDREPLTEAIQLAFGTGYGEIEASLLVADGVRSFHFTAVPLHDERGTVVGLTGVGYDISELKQLQERTTMLLEVTRDISGTLDVQSVLERVQRRTAALLPCEMVATFCWDAKRDGFCLASHYGVPEPLRAALAPLAFPLGAPFAGRVAAGETLVLEDVRDLPMVGSLLPPGSLVAAPLRVRGRFLGTLVALRTGPQPFELYQVALCEGIAAQLAVALESAELYESQRDEAQISGALARVGKELISGLNSPELLTYLCHLTAEVLDCDGSCTVLWQPADRTYVVAAADGVSEEQWESLRLIRLPPEALAGLIGALGQEEVVEIDFDAPPTPWAGLPAQYGFTAALYAALRRGHETIGVLAAGLRGRQAPFTPVQKRIIRGVAQLVSLALERVRAMEMLEEASHLKSEFVATMSHELRTPLNIMIGYNEMLLSGGCGPLSAKQTEIVERSEVSARELLQLITDTLDLSRLDAGRVAFTYTDVPPADLMREVESDTRALRKRPSVGVEWDVPGSLPTLRTDSGKLKVVIKNLLTNALKFTDTGKVTVRVRAVDAHLDIEVEDTGIGIPSNALGYIFEPFRQVDSSTTRRHGGVGLGLYIVRRLVQQLDGTIDVTSEVGVGTLFRIHLPLSIG